jgi:hypothetical protein
VKDGVEVGKRTLDTGTTSRRGLNSLRKVDISGAASAVSFGLLAGVKKTTACSTPSALLRPSWTSMSVPRSSAVSWAAAAALPASSAGAAQSASRRTVRASG